MVRFYGKTVLTNRRHSNRRFFCETSFPSHSHPKFNHFFSVQTPKSYHHLLLYRTIFGIFNRIITYWLATHLYTQTYTQVHSTHGFVLSLSPTLSHAYTFIHRHASCKATKDNTCQKGIERHKIEADDIIMLQQHIHDFK